MGHVSQKHAGVGLVHDDDSGKVAVHVQDESRRISSSIKDNRSTEGYADMLKGSYSTHDYISHVREAKKAGIGLGGKAKKAAAVGRQGAGGLRRFGKKGARAGNAAYGSLDRLNCGEDVEANELANVKMVKGGRGGAAKKQAAKKAASKRAQAKAGARGRRAARKAAHKTTSAAARQAAGKASTQSIGNAITKSPFGKYALIGIGGFLMILMILVLIITILGAANGSRYTNLHPNEARLASYLHEKGVDDMHIAAVIGCFKRETGNGFDVDINPAAVESNGIGHGISQWSFERWDGTHYKRPEQGLRQYSEAEARPWESLALQLDYMWAEMVGEGPAVPFTYVQYDHRGFLSTSTIESAVEYFLTEFLGNQGDHFDERLAYAKDIYAKMLLGGGSAEGLDGASAAQIAVVQAAKTTPTTPAGWCLKWVNNVFDNSGYSAGRQASATAAFHSFCHSSDLSELRVGMIIATNVAGNGDRNGHVGIYIGNDLVMDSIGYVRTMTVGEWTAAQRGEVRWGWAGGRDLSAL